MVLNIYMIDIIVKYVGLNTDIDHQCPILENFLKGKIIDYHLLMNNQYLPLSYIKKNEYKIKWNRFAQSNALFINRTFRLNNHISGEGHIIIIFSSTRNI